MSEGKLLAILGGGDWYDASVTHLVKLREFDLKAEHKAYRRWYREQYMPELQGQQHPVYRSFDQWLIDRGCAREATDHDIEVFHD